MITYLWYLKLSLTLKKYCLLGQSLSCHLGLSQYILYNLGEIRHILEFQFHSWLPCFWPNSLLLHLAGSKWNPTNHNCCHPCGWPEHKSWFLDSSWCKSGHCGPSPYCRYLRTEQANEKYAFLYPSPSCLFHFLLSITLSFKYISKIFKIVYFEKASLLNR